MPRIRLAFVTTPLLALVLAFVALGVACGGDGAEPTSTATPFPIATAPAPPATPSATETSPTPTSTTAPEPDPDAEDWAVPVHPAGTRTEIEVVDDAIEAVIAGDAGALAALADFTVRPCTTAMEGVGGFQCPEGVADETELPVIQLAFCEGTFATEEALAGSTESFFRNGLDGPVEELRLWAIVNIADDPTLSDSEYRLLFAFPDGTGRQVWLSEEGVTMLWWGCGEVPVTEMTAISSQDPEPDYRLPPRAAS